MASELLDEVWPTFVDDASAQVAAIGEGVLSLGQPPAQRPAPDTLRTVRRAAHSLKGAAAALELDDYASLAHHLEDLLAGFAEPDVVPPPVVGKVLSVVAVLERALESQARTLGPEVERLVGHGTHGPAGDHEAPAVEGPREVLELEALISRLCSATSGAPLTEAKRGLDLVDALRRSPAASTSPAIALLSKLADGFEALARGADDAAGLVRLAGWVVELPGALAVAPATDVPSDAAPSARRMVRVAEATLEEIDRQVDAFIFGTRRQHNEAAALGALVRALQTAHASCRQAQLDLRHQGVAVPASLDDATTALRHVEHQLARSTRELLRGSEQLSLSTSVAREQLRELRLTPARAVLEGLRRAAKELASRLGKQVDVGLEGADLAIDRHLLDTMREPLLHLVRNAVDHGLEPASGRLAANKPQAGVLQLIVRRKGSRVAIIVEDDGRGLDPEAIKAAAVRKGLVSPAQAAALEAEDAVQLIFLPGFSTASQITTTSGRGVGLDVVRATVQQLQGSIVPTWRAGRGTTFTIDLPLTISTSWVILAKSAGERCALPTDAIERMGRLDVGALARSPRAVAVIDGERLPFRTLASVWGSDAPPASDPTPYVLLDAGGQRGVFAVDELSSHHEVVVQTLGKRAAMGTHLAGAAVLDDGSAVGVLSPAALLESQLAPSGAPRRGRVLVVDDSLTTRAMMRGLVSLAGYEVLVANDGEEALVVLENEGADLIVSDVEMPRLDGLGLCRRVRNDQRWERLPVILVTSLDSHADRSAGAEAGADAYLVKREVVKGALIDLVNAFLRSPSEAARR